MPEKPITAIIVGAGHRAIMYASYAEKRPDILSIVGVADPSPLRRRQAAERFGFGEDMCFASSDELAARGRLADVIINGTGDFQHVPTTLPLLDAGYHVLLEKPFAVNEAEMWQLAEAARRNDRRVMVCHVLRFSPFYQTIRQKLADGAIGEILNIQMTEHVSYHHMSVSYVRGKRNREAVSAPMLLAKCSHDLDLLVWMMGGVAPRAVASLGGRMFFREDKAPAGAGTRCLLDCPIEESCLYSARKLYLDHPKRWRTYVWESIEHIADPTPEQKIESLRTDNPFGRCVWKCDNDMVDHQSVLIEFENGTTATHNMIGGSAKGSRKLHIIGTIGEIFGNFEDNVFTIRRIDPSPDKEHEDEVVDLKAMLDGGGHGGGDLRLVADFCQVVRGEKPSLSTTSLEDSINGHLICFRADDAMCARRVVEL